MWTICCVLNLSKMFWFNFGIYPSKIFNPHAKIMNDVLVRNFVKMHYQFSAKVMDPNFIRRVAKKYSLNKFVNNFTKTFLLLGGAAIKYCT